MANHHLTGMLANKRPPVMVVHRLHTVMPAKAGIQGTHNVMPAKVGIQELSLTVMPAEAGIHSSRTEHWIPACAGMTAQGRVHTFDAARREAARLAVDAADIAALEQAERQLEGKGRGKKK